MLTFRMPNALVSQWEDTGPYGRCLKSRAISLMVNSKKTKIVVSTLKRIKGDNIACLGPFNPFRYSNFRNKLCIDNQIQVFNY